MSIIRLVIKYSFLINLIRDSNVKNMIYKPGQFNDSLILWKPRFTCFFETERVAIMYNRDQT